jgi:uncharacterized protein with von Willebrand factor type A (vWA) domain
LTAHGHEVLVETGAGQGSSFTDEAYQTAGARIVDVHAAWSECDVASRSGSRSGRSTTPQARHRAVPAATPSERLPPQPRRCQIGGRARLGESLRRFNDLAIRRSLTRGATVVLCSDCKESAALTCSTRRWPLSACLGHAEVANPLARCPGYQQAAQLRKQQSRPHHEDTHIGLHAIAARAAR